MPGMSAEEAVGRMRLQPVTQSAIGMMLLSKKTDEEVRDFFDGVDEIPSYTGGVEMVIEDLHRIRKQDYAYIEVDSETARYSLAAMSPNNLYTGVALVGDIKDASLQDLKASIDEALQVMFPEAP